MTAVETSQSICRFGVARRDITPPVGIYHRMWGAATHDQAEGVHRPLTATAIVFQAADRDARHAQVLIAIDHCLLARDEVDQLFATIHARTGLDHDSLTVVCSHTHAAGMMTLDRQSFPGGERIPAYLSEMNERIADGVGEALGRVEEATIVYGTARCTLAANRDFRDTSRSQWILGFNPGGEADDTALVARVTALDGRLLATVVNYACHPTTLAWDNRLISPDFPGAMRETVERATEAPCVFVQGASGDLGPVEGFVGDTAVADRNGRQLGYAVLSALESLPPPRTRYVYQGPVISGATIGVWEHQSVTAEREAALRVCRVSLGELPLAYRPGLPTVEATIAERERLRQDEQQARQAGDTARARDLRALVERQTRILARIQALPSGPTYPYRTRIWKLGDAVWLAVQGEPYQVLQQALRRRFPGTPIVVASLANSWGPSYLPPAPLYDTGMYEESIALLAPGSLERLVEALGDDVAQLLA